MNFQNRMALLLAAFVIVIMVGFGVITGIQENREATAAMERNRQEIASRLAGNLAAPIWDYDYDAALERMLVEDDQSIVAVIVTSGSDFTLAVTRDGEEVITYNTDAEELQAYERDELATTVDVVRNEEVLAELTIFFTDRYLRQELKAGIIQAVLQSLIIALIVAFVGWITARYMAGPIKLITQGATLLSEGDVALTGIDRKRLEAMKKRKDELGAIGRAFGTLIEYLNSKAELASSIADKDLRAEISASSESDKLGTALGEMTDVLNGFLYQIGTAANRISEESEQVAQYSQALSTGATEQASSLEEISSSIEEVTSQSRHNSESADKANALAKSAVKNAEGGTDRMKELLEAMQSISDSSESIKKVVKVIDDIAFQINLLALNANVEAARAGKYGKGFAVVAEEVRNLAVRSAAAVKETTVMVEESVSSIDRGNHAAASTEEQLAAIVSDITKVDAILGEILEASNEQVKAIEQVSTALDQIDNVTQSTAASAEESAASSQELASQAVEIRKRIAEFKLRNTLDMDTSMDDEDEYLPDQENERLSLPAGRF